MVLLNMLFFINFFQLDISSITILILAMKNIFPGNASQGFKIVSLPEHRVAQQPPISVMPILASAMNSQAYKGLVSSASLIGGMPLFLYLFARVREQSIFIIHKHVK